MKLLTAVAIALLSAAQALAQTPDKKLEFEVASVRPSSKDLRDAAVALGLRMDGLQARIGALTLRDYIAMAYRIKGDALSQPGLKLESRKAPVDLLVVDQVLKTPTDN